jgi:general secretion pathway protein B
MSYILDALRRADAERERGGVPSLHSQQYGALPGDEGEAPRRSYLLIGAVVALALALASVLLRSYFGSGGSDATPTRAVVPAPPAPVPTAAPLPLPTPPAVSLPSAVPPREAPAANVATEPAVVAARGPARDGASAGPRPVPMRAAAKAQARPDAAASASPPPAATGERIYAMADLPEAIRRDLPKLAFGGATYSSDAASRMVILNGQVFHEGDTVARDLQLQTVKRKSAVLAFRGYRYEMGF